MRFFIQFDIFLAPAPQLSLLQSEQCFSIYEFNNLYLLEIKGY